MPVQHTEDENQSSWWIIELGGQLTVRLCLHKAKHPVNSAQKKNGLAAGKNEISWSGLCRQNKTRNEWPYNSMVNILAEFTNLKARKVRVRLLKLSEKWKGLIEQTKIDSLILCEVLRSSVSSVISISFSTFQLKMEIKKNPSQYPQIWVTY